MKKENKYYKLIVMLLFAAMLTLVSGRCDEAEEDRLCEDLAEDLCSKWFECWPVISIGWWGDVGTCRTRTKANCSNTEVLYDCDLDNDDLRDCADNVDGSSCGFLPTSCQDFVDCNED